MQRGGHRGIGEGGGVAERAALGHVAQQVAQGLADYRSLGHDVVFDEM